MNYGTIKFALVYLLLFSANLRAQAPAELAARRYDVRSGLFAKGASKLSIRNLPKYSDEPSYRIRQNLQFSSERMRSMLRSIDTVLTG